MLSMNFKFDERAFMRAIQDGAKKTIEDKVRHIRCPEHNETARIRFTGHGDKLTWEVSGCCDALAEAVKNALG